MQSNKTELNTSSIPQSFCFYVFMHIHAQGAQGMLLDVFPIVIFFLKKGNFRKA